VNTAWQRYVNLVTGLTQVTQKHTEQVVRVLVRRGEVEASRGEKTVEDLLDRVTQNRNVIANIIKSEVEQAARRLGLARQSDISRLEAKITRLEAMILHLKGAPSAPSPDSEQRDAQTLGLDKTEES
jgi:polyhydroxyalkanoate synthesis regulator phasin